MRLCGSFCYLAYHTFSLPHLKHPLRRHGSIWEAGGIIANKRFPCSAFRSGGRYTISCHLRIIASCECAVAVSGCIAFISFSLAIPLHWETFCLGTGMSCVYCSCFCRLVSASWRVCFPPSGSSVISLHAMRFFQGDVSELR